LKPPANIRSYANISGFDDSEHTLKDLDDLDIENVNFIDYFCPF
jgi:hypothetical protein